MPVILATLGGMLLQIAPGIVRQVLVALGIATVSYVGLDASLAWLKTQAIANFNLLPPSVFGILSVLKVGVALNMVFSAMVMRATLNGFSGGTFKRWTKT
ncbi:MAG: DUF2523 domain-containing protein [Burkholderiales bacterium]|nr:DUF2523 domain-containing protein [Burkholderiales bacterium]